MTNDLVRLFNEMDIKKEGKLFEYRMDGLKSYGITLKRLLARKEISRYYTLHQLRKTFITKLIEHGMPIHNVKALADHTDIDTTLRYYAVVNVKKMGDDMNTKGIFRDILRDNKRLIG